MRAGTALAIVAILVVLLVSASASDTDWRMKLATQEMYLTAGTQANASDGIGEEDGLSLPWDFRGAFVLSLNSGSLLSRDIRAPIPPGATKTWNLRVGATPGYPNPIRLTWATLASTVLPQNVEFMIRMVDNKGMLGAPANGAMWVLSAPTAHPATYTDVITLPTLHMSQFTSETVIAEAYKMELTATNAVPEPGGLIVLGLGVLGAGRSFAGRLRLAMSDPLRSGKRRRLSRGRSG